MCSSKVRASSECNMNVASDDKYRVVLRRYLKTVYCVSRYMKFHVSPIVRMNRFMVCIDSFQCNLSSNKQKRNDSWLLTVRVVSALVQTHCICTKCPLNFRWLSALAPSLPINDECYCARHRTWGNCDIHIRP